MVVWVVTCCYMQKGIWIPLGGKYTDPTVGVGVKEKGTKDVWSEKDERLKRMDDRKNHWLAMRIAKELVLEMVDNTRNKSVRDQCMRVVVEDVITEVIMRSEVAGMIQKVESSTGMEARLFQELGQRLELRKKHARIAKRMELEAIWLARRKEEEMRLSMLRLETGVENIHLSELDQMEWEEHDLEYLLAALKTN